MVFTVDGVEYSVEQVINPDEYSDGISLTLPVDITLSSDYYTSTPVYTDLFITDINGNFINVNSFTDWDTYFESGTTPTWVHTVEDFTGNSNSFDYYGNILGIKFSNVQIPKLSGKQVIGYYIVRQERTDSEKTILDSAVMFRTTKSGKYTSSGLLIYDHRYVNNTISTNKKVWSFISP